MFAGMAAVSAGGGRTTCILSAALLGSTLTIDRSQLWPSQTENLCSSKAPGEGEEEQGPLILDMKK